MNPPPFSGRPEGALSWQDELRADLAQLNAAGLLRQLHPVEHAGRIVRVAGRDLINLASNDYLGLSQHPALKAAAIRAVEQFGTGSGASRLAGGHSTLHAEVERRFASFKHAQAALICPTGYMANLAVLTTLAGPGDLVCLDKLNHASLIDAARASGPTVRVFPHLGYDKLRRLLQSEANRRLIVTDSIFSMDGDTADLPVLCDLAEQHDAILVVDEAHGTGVLGATGAGLCEAQGVTDRVDVVVSTASKALGGLGGIVTAKQIVIDSILNHARSFIYTTAVPPAQAAAIGAALDVIAAEPRRRERLAALSPRLKKGSQAFFEKKPCDPFLTPIVPLIVGSPERALALSGHLRDAGFLAPAIRPPTVAPGSSRVRISLRADLEDADIDRLLDAINSWKAG